MNAILSLVGPLLVRLVSTRAAQLVAVAVARAVLDKVESVLRARGYPDMADVLDAIERDVLADVGGLVSAAQDALLSAPDVATKAAG